MGTSNTLSYRNTLNYSDTANYITNLQLQGKRELAKSFLEKILEDEFVHPEIKKVCVQVFDSLDKQLYLKLEIAKSKDYERAHKTYMDILDQDPEEELGKQCYKCIDILNNKAIQKYLEDLEEIKHLEEMKQAA